MGRSDDHLIFIMEIPISRETVFLLRRDPVCSVRENQMCQGAYANQEYTTNDTERLQK